MVVVGKFVMSAAPTLHKLFQTVLNTVSNQIYVYAIIHKKLVSLEGLGQC